MQNCYAILQYLEKSMEGFLRATYAAMEPRQYRPKGGMSVSEGRNGGGAKACPLELAMAQNGRAIRTTVLKSTVQKIPSKKMPVRKPKLSPSEKAQRGSKRLKINKVWYIILAKGLQKGKKRLCYVVKQPLRQTFLTARSF